MLRLKSKNCFKISKIDKHNSRQFLKSTALFVTLLAIEAGLLDWRTIHKNVVHGYGLSIYGQSGIVIVFALIVLSLLIKRSGAKKIKIDAWTFCNLKYLLVSIVAVCMCWVILGSLNVLKPKLGWTLLANTLIVLTGVSLIIFAYGTINIRRYIVSYKRELLLSVGIGVAFSVFLLLLYGIWPDLSKIVLRSDRAIFNLFGIFNVYRPPYQLIFSKFTVSVGKYCSGIDSIALFTSLYLIIGILDWQRLIKSKYLSIFIPSLMILFCFNILRVFGLILAGYYINPHIAFSLFHTYAGMIFFVIYSSIFWKLSYGWMLEKS